VPEPSQLALHFAVKYSAWAVQICLKKSEKNRKKSWLLGEKIRKPKNWKLSGYNQQGASLQSHQQCGASLHVASGWARHTAGAEWKNCSPSIAGGALIYALVLAQSIHRSSVQFVALRRSSLRPTSYALQLPSVSSSCRVSSFDVKIKTYAPRRVPSVQVTRRPPSSYSWPYVCRLPGRRE